MAGWDYHYRDKGIYGYLSIPAFLGMAVGAFSVGSWMGLVAFILLVAALVWKTKGLNALDSFSNVVQPMFVIFTIAAFAWWMLKRFL
ncbi:hypothetical protein [Magnetospirillum gryphiswaldense]|uniref:Membrane protein n=1 Tax=Magnetospirillum gryphiswaldense TaxID=55518 RepID=A4U0E3_9PROT|nr:hypothetical protein [Magnetospirillum gryphiswaldense]CAM76350.1 membrane protein [Magnetospirillum gryphiswaldense MSR-1]